MFFVTGRYIRPGARGKTVRLCWFKELEEGGRSIRQMGERRRVLFMFDVLVSLAFGSLLTSSSSLVSVFMLLSFSSDLFACVSNSFFLSSPLSAASINTREERIEAD